MLRNAKEALRLKRLLPAIEAPFLRCTTTTPTLRKEAELLLCSRLKRQPICIVMGKNSSQFKIQSSVSCVDYF